MDLHQQAESPTMAMVASAAATLNAEGMRLLASGEISGASVCFRNALALLNGEYQGVAMTIRSPHLLGDICKLETGLTIPGLEDDGFYIHNQAMSVTDITARNSEDTSNRIHLMAIAVLFNLALCLHQKGMHSCNDNTLMLRHACHIYLLCREHALQHPVTAATPVVILCMNNEAQIRYRLLGEKETSLGLLKSMRQDHLGGDLVNLPLLEQVILNLIVVPNAPLISSPAA